MKHVAAIALGILMMLVAVYLAAGSTTQDRADQPEVARRLATELHFTPSPSPIPSDTPIPSETPTPAPSPTDTIIPSPTPTPYPAWLKLTGAGISIRLPESYDSITFLTPDMSGATESTTLSSGLVSVEYVLDCERGFPRGPRNLRIARITGRVSADMVPYVILRESPAPDRTTLVPNSRYNARQLTVSGLVVAEVPVVKLLYWFPRGGVFWLVEYTAPASEFALRLPAFEQSFASFTIEGAN